MKIECVQKVGEVQKSRLYDFDSEKEADVKLVKDLLENDEKAVFDEEPMVDILNAGGEYKKARLSNGFRFATLRAH
jgi:hypothetical protein